MKHHLKKGAEDIDPLDSARFVYISDKTYTARQVTFCTSMTLRHWILCVKSVLVSMFSIGCVPSRMMAIKSKVGLFIAYCLSSGSTNFDLVTIYWTHDASFCLSKSIQAQI